MQRAPAEETTIRSRRRRSTKVSSLWSRRGARWPRAVAARPARPARPVASEQGETPDRAAPDRLALAAPDRSALAAFQVVVRARAVLGVGSGVTADRSALAVSPPVRRAW